MNIKCFLLEPNGKEWRYFRRFSFSSGGSCPNSEHQSGHDYQIPAPDGDLTNDWIDPNSYPQENFPTHCSCGYEFTKDNTWQIFTIGQYISKDRPGELFSIRTPPAGAIWRATWYEDIKSMCGIDGKSYIVETPAGPWHIDGTASNCDLPDVDHKCWCRHGEAPNFTIDKNGVTCSAGAGSILIRGYHGFLRDGYLIDC